MNTFEEEDSGLEFSKPNKISRRPIKTALHQAVLDERIHQVRLLVFKHGASVDCKDVYGRTPLMLACLLENEEHGKKLAKILLKAGAYINVKDTMGRTALSFACMKGRLDIIKLFLKDDLADINCPDNDGSTPLTHAALSGQPEIVKILVNVMVQYGMQIDSRNSLGYTPLLLACKYGHFASAYILLVDGQASPTLRDNEFFLNAQDWILKSSEPSFSFSMQRSKTMPTISLSSSFTRENTVYRKSATPQCRHYNPRQNPMVQSLDTAMHLPAIFSKFPNDKPLEMSIDGVDSRMLLLRAIDDIIANPRYRPVSRAVSSNFARYRSYPATPKLLAMTNRSCTMMVPDMTTLFRLYSDQYEPGKRKGQNIPSIPNDPKDRSVHSSPGPRIGLTKPNGMVSIDENASILEVV